MTGPTQHCILYQSKTSSIVTSWSCHHCAMSVRGTAWYSLATRGLVLGGGVGGGVGRMVHCNSYSDD